MKKVFIRTARLVFWAEFCLVLSGCNKENNPLIPPIQNSKAIKGYGISPQGFPLDYSKLTDFFREVGNTTNGGVLFNGAWRDDAVNGTDAGKIPNAAVVTMENSTIYQFTPMMVFGWRRETTLYLKVPADPTNDWTNTQARYLFQSMLSNFVKAYKPLFVFLGNENDFYYEQNPVDYNNWIQFYNTAYDSIKSASPGTSVGPVFSFEHISGSGTLNGWNLTHWRALTSHDFSKIDLVGVTVYPWLNYTTAGSIPSHYLDSLVSRIGSKPIAITETGWPAESLGAMHTPWETSETAQVTYLSRLSTMLSEIRVRLIDWLFLYPMQDPGGSPMAWKLFGSISIRDGLGNKRAVYNPWISFSP